MSSPIVNGTAYMRNRGRRPTICPETCLVDPYYEPKHLRQKLSNLAQVSGELDGQSETRLLVLYTGGTIGMKTNSDGGKFSSPLVMHDNSQLRGAIYQVNVLACLVFVSGVRRYNAFLLFFGTCSRNKFP